MEKALATADLVRDTRRNQALITSYLSVKRLNLDS